MERLAGFPSDMDRDFSLNGEEERDVEEERESSGCSCRGSRASLFLLDDPSAPPDAPLSGGSVMDLRWAPLGGGLRRLSTSTCMCWTDLGTPSMWERWAGFLVRV